MQRVSTLLETSLINVRLRSHDLRWFEVEQPIYMKFSCSNERLITYQIIYSPIVENS